MINANSAIGQRCRQGLVHGLGCIMSSGSADLLLLLLVVKIGICSQSFLFSGVSPHREDCALTSEKGRIWCIDAFSPVISSYPYNKSSSRFYSFFLCDFIPRIGLDSSESFIEALYSIFTTNLSHFHKMSKVNLSIVKTIIFSLKYNFVGVFFLLLALSYVYNRYRPGLSRIPGPSLAKWTKLWRLYDVYKGQSHQTAIRLHKKHGPLVRIGPNIISVGDPAAIKTIYGLTGAFTKVGQFTSLAVCFYLHLLFSRHSTLFKVFLGIRNRK